MACEALQSFQITVYPREFFNGSSEQLLCDVGYPWIDPPTQRIPKSIRASIVAPAVGALTVIWEYTVPDGFYLVIDRDMHAYNGTGFTEGSGGIIWGLDVNRPLAADMATGRPISQFISTGGGLERPWPVPPILFRGADTLRYKVIITDPTVGVGAPNMIHAAVGGWLYPMARNT